MDADYERDLTLALMSLDEWTRETSQLNSYLWNNMVLYRWWYFTGLLIKLGCDLWVRQFQSLCLSAAGVCDMCHTRNCYRGAETVNLCFCSEPMSLEHQQTNGNEGFEIKLRFSLEVKYKDLFCLAQFLIIHLLSKVRNNLFECRYMLRIRQL